MYLDASAIVKLVVAEAESEALRGYLRTRLRRSVNRVAHVEVARALMRTGVVDARVEDAFLGVEVIELDAKLATEAATIEPSTLRSLDAIHLVSALAVADELEAFVTYDARLGKAAKRHGLKVVSPA